MAPGSDTEAHPLDSVTGKDHGEGGTDETAIDIDVTQKQLEATTLNENVSHSSEDGSELEPIITDQLAMRIALANWFAEKMQSEGGLASTGNSTEGSDEVDEQLVTHLVSRIGKYTPGPEQQKSLCSCCRRLTPQLISQERHEQCSFRHHPTYNALEESARNGCELCSLLVYSISRRPEQYPWKRTDAVTVSSTKFDRQSVDLAHLVAGKIRGKAIPADWNDDDIPLVKSNFLEIETATIKYWLSICPKNHVNCYAVQPNNGGFLPTRVVEVGSVDSPTVRLVHTQGLDLVDKKYIALSHCWGLNMPSSAKTTLETLDNRLTSIDMSDLTRTFGDSIEITRRLGVPYIWIDSLCIIQDSVEDWEKEAAVMAKVYMCAYLTIAASASADGTGGCRILEEQRPAGPVDLEMEAKDTSGQKTRIRIYSHPPKEIPNVLLQDPLHQRGWTLQERELSPRVVHYCHDSLRWECQSLQASLEFPWDDSLSFNGNLRIFDKGQLYTPPPSSLPVTSSSDEEHPSDTPIPNQVRTRKPRPNEQRHVWFDVVQRYTRRSLTYQVDTLPALSGIAQRIHEITGDTYYAGLWDSFLLYGLLWSSQYKEESYRLSGKTHQRHPKYLAPSWSWASLGCPVSYDSWIHNESALNPSPTPGLVPKILEVVTVPSGNDPFGMVQSGFIRLNGRVKPAIAKDSEIYTANSHLPQPQSQPQSEPSQSSSSSQSSSQTQAQTQPANVGGIPGFTKIGTINYDYASDVPPGQPNMVFILCCLPRKEDYGDVIGLGLYPTNLMKMEFRRIGLVTIKSTTWWDEILYSNITIT